MAGHIPHPGAEGISVIIPYRNGNALASYYLGIFGALIVFVVCSFGAAVVGSMGGARRGSSAASVAGMVAAAVMVAALGSSIPVVAVLLGLKGLAAAKSTPKVRGRVHAWIGIVGGSFGILIAVIGLVGMLVMTFGRRGP